jgi:hypothetical protein
MISHRILFQPGMKLMKTANVSGCFGHQICNPSCGQSREIIATRSLMSSLEVRSMHKTVKVLRDKAKKTAVALLNCSIADGIDVGLLTKPAHWNLRGPEFISVHEMRDGFRSQIDGHVGLNSDLLGNGELALAGAPKTETVSNGMGRRLKLGINMLLCVAMVLALPVAADARGGGGGGHGSGGSWHIGGFGHGGGFGGHGFGRRYGYGGFGFYGYDPFWYSGEDGGYPDYYDYPYAYAPTATPPAAQSFWYFCRSAKEYYPYVRSCPGGWQKVSPTPRGRTG